MVCSGIDRKKSEMIFPFNSSDGNKSIIMSKRAGKELESATEWKLREQLFILLGRSGPPTKLK